MRAEDVLFVIGGRDPRNAYLANLLVEDGYKVVQWDAEANEAEIFSAPCVLILELYTQSDALWHILRRLRSGSICFGGKIGQEHMRFAQLNGITYFNVLEQEVFCIQNSIPTAEGALMAAMQNTPFTIHGSKTTVLGYGRIGKAVAHLFSCCASEVTVVSRLREELAYAQARGLRTKPLSAFSEALKDADIVINTVPARLLDARALACIHSGTLILELASGTDNIDLAQVNEYGLNLVRAGSLPGKAAPASAAQYLKETMLYCLRISDDQTQRTIGK